MTIQKKDNDRAMPIYNQKLAGWLMLNGFKLMGMEDNKKYIGKNIFYFMETDKLHKSINSYFGRPTK